MAYQFTNRAREAYLSSLEKINEAILKKIKTLNLHFETGLVPRKLWNLSHLTKLSLDGCHISFLSSEISNLTNLTSLNLCRNNLNSLPPEISKLTKLTEINLSGNNFSEIPAGVFKLKNLRKLQISNNKIQNIPEKLSKLINLTKLDLAENHLKVLKGSFVYPKNATNLIFSRNQLTDLPKEFLNQINPKVLDLSGNKLKTLPSAIGNLTNLNVLDLNQNCIVSLPNEIANLKKLTNLNLSDNRLESLPPIIGNLSNLESLNFSQNKRSYLPMEISNLKKLHKINLGNNDYAEIPKVIFKCDSIQELDLSGNRLKHIPSKLFDLVKLKRLYLGSNLIENIPAQISNLSKLSTLEIANNRLKLLPTSISALPNLKELQVNKNRLSPELSAANNQGFHTLITYLREQAENEVVINEAKLIFIGEGEVGKTSLLGALRGDSWVENRPSTHGVEVDIKSLSIRIPGRGVEVILNGWDFGGQNIYRHTHQLFFTAPALYLTVWNPRRGPDQCRVDEWIKMVKHRAFDEEKIEERPRIIVVATHGGPKERLDHIDEASLLKEFGNLIDGFFHVDSKTRLGIPELKEFLGQTALKISHVGRSVPRSWMNVLEALRKRSQQDAYISYKQFLDLCSKEKVSNELADTYAILFNEIGYIIYYREDHSLNDTVILKPEWLSKAISFVLEDREVKNQNGLVRYDRLQIIWNDPDRPGSDRYPDSLHRIFLRLMERFDLAYKVVMPDDSTQKTWLIAQLVPGGRPEKWDHDWVSKFDDTERTQVCRILDAETGRTAIAEGLMYRLIVRLHRYSLGRENYYNSCHWKNGIILDDGFNGRALIEETAGDVHVTVRAAYPERFLSHLCSEIQWLVEYFWKGLDAQLFVPCHPPCKGLIEIDEMMEYKASGVLKIRCSVCRKIYEIDSFMTTAAPKPKIEEAFDTLMSGQQEIMKAVTEGFDNLSVNLRTVMSQADQQFEALLTTLTDPAKDGPRLFSMAVDPKNRTMC